jgi:hypothetical protein
MGRVRDRLAEAIDIIFDPHYHVVVFIRIIAQAAYDLISHLIAPVRDHRSYAISIRLEILVGIIDAEYVVVTDDIV